MPKKVMQKGRKMEPNWVQNGSPNRSKIGKRRKKGDPKIDAKNDTKNGGVIKPTLGTGGTVLEPAGGLGGTVKPDLIQISFKTACTWRGAADVF